MSEQEGRRHPAARAALMLLVAAVSGWPLPTAAGQAPAQGPPAQGQPAQGQPAPGQPAPGPAGQGRAGGPAAPTTAVLPRTFAAPVGLVFNTVRPERVADFERLLAEVQTALAASKNPTTQAQAKGWRFYKAAEAAPGGAVMFVFVIDPVVPNEDYSLGKVLVDAFPDPVKLQEIWALYTNSVTGGGSLVNLTPVSAVVKPAAAPPPAAPAVPAPGAAPGPVAPVPSPDTDPTTRAR